MKWSREWESLYENKADTECRICFLSEDIRDFEKRKCVGEADGIIGACDKYVTSLYEFVATGNTEIMLY